MLTIKKLPGRMDFRLLSNREREQLCIPPLPNDLGDLRNPFAEEVERAIRSVPVHRSALCYMAYNSSRATTAAPVKQPTGTAIRTMMQLNLGAGITARIIEWGCSFDGSAAATPGQVELFETSVAATMSTQFVDADIQSYNNANGPAQGGTANIPINTGGGNSGFATAAVTEGTVANYRGFDLQMLPPTAPYVKQFPLGREPELKASNFLRIRVTFSASVNMYCYVIFEA